MQSCDDIARFLEQHAPILKLLTTVSELGVDDCWIGAGLIRNAVWNHLHGLPTRAVPGSDVDVVYRDPAHASRARDLALEAQLLAKIPDVPWSVHNQARMQVGKADPAYCDVADAIRCWPETATAIAARAVRGRVEVLAPHGVADLVGLIVRPTPAFMHKLPVYRARLAEKDWGRRWPKLQFVDYP